MSMSESHIRFNQDLIDAKVVGCAYGFSYTEGVDFPIPVLSLVVLHEEKIRSAFECFREWGCEEDGDVVSAEILLKNDGTYRLTMGPDVERMSYRFAAQSSLNEPLFFGLNWIKKIDSTNEILLDWADSNKSRYTPIMINAVTSSGGKKIPSADAISNIERLPKIIKLGLKVSTETEFPDHWLLKFEDKIKPKRAAAEQIQSIYRARKNIIDLAFPVTRNRVDRSFLKNEIRAKNGMGMVTDDQIVQAIVNLVISFEICNDTPHYNGIQDIDSTVWDYVSNRYEHADGSNLPSKVTSELVAKQIELDVAMVLRKYGAQIDNLKFESRQKLLVRKGYGNA